MILGSVVSLVTTVIIIPFAVFFLLKDGPAMLKHIFSLIPNRYFEMSLNMMYKIDQQLGGYLRGQFFDALIIGILAILALWILDVKYFFLIGIFAGLSNMIPYVGPIVGGSAAVLVVLMTGGSGITMLLVVAAFLIIQLADNVLVQPLVVARSVDLHPLLIIFSVIIGGQFFGIMGMLLAVPATGIIKVLISELYLGIRKYNVI
jgi:predicted PurR-regulated permease PerM